MTRYHGRDPSRSPEAEPSSDIGDARALYGREKAGVTFEAISSSPTRDNWRAVDCHHVVETQSSVIAIPGIVHHVAGKRIDHRHSAVQPYVGFRVNYPFDGIGRWRTVLTENVSRTEKSGPDPPSFEQKSIRLNSYRSQPRPGASTARRSCARRPRRARRHRRGRSRRAHRRADRGNDGQKSRARPMPNDRWPASQASLDPFADHQHVAGLGEAHGSATA
jgi:hypothetical protein